MTENQFTDFIKRIRNAYGQRQLPEEVLEFLFEECGFIEAKAAKKIFESFLSNHDKLPTKLHLAILSEYANWSRHQGEPKKFRYEKCPNNMPDEEGPCYYGELFLYRDGEEYGFGRNSYAFVCDECQRSSNTKSNCPQSTLKKLLSEGWSITPLNQDLPPPDWVIEHVAASNFARGAATSLPRIDWAEIVKEWPQKSKDIRRDSQRTRYDREGSYT